MNQIVSNRFQNTCLVCDQYHACSCRVDKVDMVIKKGAKTSTRERNLARFKQHFLNTLSAVLAQFNI